MSCCASIAIPALIEPKTGICTVSLDISTNVALSKDNGGKKSLIEILKNSANLNRMSWLVFLSPISYLEIV